MRKSVLVSGAGFAGLATGYWMNKLGYDVTLVEIAGSLKRGGTPVDIKNGTIEIARRMGLLERIEANAINMEVVEFKNADDVTEKSEFKGRDPLGEIEYEIERDVLLSILYEAVQDKVEFMFGNSIVSLHDMATGVEVVFKGGGTRSFDLVFGCDGSHSVVRKLCFGEEARFSHFLKAYFSITIVDKLLIKENTTQLYNEPGKAIMLNAYNNKTDIVLCFFSAAEISYDYRNEQQQRDMMTDHFSGVGWRTLELLDEVRRSTTFYFDKLCQIKMPSWTRGRVALVGDAGYCASPAAGRGGSLAIDGAGALAEAFQKCHGDFERAFLEYDTSFRPFIEQVQQDVVSVGLEMFLPRTAEAIRLRNR